MIRKLIPIDAERLGVEHIWVCKGGEESGKKIVVGDVLRAEMEGVKSLAVLVCAPGGMADEVRREIVAVVGNGGTRIDYHEESFGRVGCEVVKK